MIERITAETGEEVLRVGGRLLASRVDPRAEARAWADARGAFLDRVRTVIVLGLGAGYHVDELTKRTPADVLVLETNQEIVHQRPLTFDPDRVRIGVVSGVADVRASASVRRAVRTSYLTLVHQPSRALAPDLYGDLVRQLNGREWGSLDWIWSLRGLANEGEGAPSTAPLTIHDLAQAELVGDDGERRALLIKALRELVK